MEKAEKELVVRGLVATLHHFIPAEAAAHWADASRRAAERCAALHWALVPGTNREERQVAHRQARRHRKRKQFDLQSKSRLEVAKERGKRV